MDDGGNVIGDAAEAATGAGGGFLGELKKIGQTALSQITGSGAQIPTADQVKQLAKKDEQFSKEAQAEIQARIRAIYEEYAAKRKKHEMIATQQEQQFQEQKKQELDTLKKQEPLSPAIAKTRAEIKNYGAE